MVASTADDIASFLVTADRSNGNTDGSVPSVQEQRQAQQSGPAEQDSTAAEDEDEGEWERVTEEDQLDPEDPETEVLMRSMCAERLARIRLHWAQAFASAPVKEEAEAAVAQQVLLAYDDLYDEAHASAGDSEGSEDGHEEWREETDWGGQPSDSSDESDASRSDEERDWDEPVEEQEEQRYKAAARRYRRWRNRAGQDEAEADSSDEEPSSTATSDEDEDYDGVNIENERRQHGASKPRARSPAQPHIDMPDRARSPQPRLNRSSREPISPQLELDISDILSEPRMSGSGTDRPGQVWTVFEDGSEGYVNDPSLEEWVRQELGDGCDSKVPTETSRSADNESATADSEAQLKKQDDDDDDDSEEEVKIEQGRGRDRHSASPPREAKRRRSQHSARSSSRAKRRRVAERKKTVRRQTSTVRETRTTTIHTTDTVWSADDDSDSDDDDSHSSAAHVEPARRQRQRERADRAGKSTAASKSTVRERNSSLEKRHSDEREAFDSETETKSEKEANAPEAESRDGSAACIECGAAAFGDVADNFCSPTCQQWVEHKRFLVEMHRGMHSNWQQRHDNYYQPTHNLPLYPTSSKELLLCQLPFAVIAKQSATRSSPLVEAYLAYQLAMQPAVRLGRSPIHGTGVFTTAPVAAGTRLLSVFGLLYPRDALLDDCNRKLPAALAMDRLLDVDVLSCGEVSLVMSISRACVGGYVNSAHGTGRRQNVRFECGVRQDERRWHKEGWVPSGLMVVVSVRDIAAGVELLENYPIK